MTLVERLRGYKATPRHADELCADAADEIDHLTAELAECRKQREWLAGVVMGEYPSTDFRYIYAKGES